MAKKIIKVSVIDIHRCNDRDYFINYDPKIELSCHTLVMAYTPAPF